MERGSKNSSSSLPFPMDSDQPDPWLLISKGEKLQNHAFYSISKNEVIKRNIPEFRNKQISTTCYHGWVALIDVGKLPVDCCLLNTTSKEKIQLPHIDIESESRGWFYTCILSKPPSDPDCHVLFLSSSDASIRFCRLGDEKFIKRCNKFGDDYLQTATNFKGKVYAWMTTSCSIVQVDFVGKDIILKQLVNEASGQPCKIPWPSPSTSLMFSDYLVDSSDDLLLLHMICYTHSGEVAYFRIFKVNILNNECSELMSIGNRTIFLGPFENMSLCGSDNSSLKKNSIYFIWKDRYLYMYDIEDRSKTLFKLCPIQKGTPSLLSWVMM